MKLTVQQLVIGAGGVIFGAVFLSFALLVGWDSVWGSLLLNLSAGALTIALTALTVDYLIQREAERKAAPTVKLAKMMAIQISMSIRVALKDPFGVNVTHIDSRHLDKIVQGIDVGLKKVDFDAARPLVTKSDLNNFFNTMENVESKLGEIINLCGQAMPSEHSSIILELRQSCAWGREYSALIDKPSELRVAVQICGKIYNKTKDMDRILGIDFKFNEHI